MSYAAACLLRHTQMWDNADITNGSKEVEFEQECHGHVNMTHTSDQSLLGAVHVSSRETVRKWFVRWNLQPSQLRACSHPCCGTCAATCLHIVRGQGRELRRAQEEMAVSRGNLGSGP